MCLCLGLCARPIFDNGEWMKKEQIDGVSEKKVGKDTDSYPNPRQLVLSYFYKLHNFKLLIFDFLTQFCLYHLKSNDRRLQKNLSVEMMNDTHSMFAYAWFLSKDGQRVLIKLDSIVEMFAKTNSSRSQKKQ